MSGLVNRRYWIFGIDEYYPSGGADDLVGTADDLEGCKKVIKDVDKTRHADFYEVFDTLNMIDVEVNITYED